ncbi:MAG: hypothetical protein ACFFD4_27500 [Candidatus Odinarchaeota archaeon]
MPSGWQPLESSYLTKRVVVHAHAKSLSAVTTPASKSLTHGENRVTDSIAPLVFQDHWFRLLLLEA